MKRIVLLIGILISVTAVHLVLGQGVIVYEVKINNHRMLSPEREAVKEMIPEHNKFKDQLIFNKNESLYKPADDDEEDSEHESGGLRMLIKRPRSESYTDFTSGTKISSLELMGKKYLVEDSVKILPWKFGEETAMIIGYECKNASYYSEEKKQIVVAWYTNKLLPFVGPEGYNSLPGTVLKVDINNGDRVITALEITMRALKKSELKAPTSGQRITGSQYRSLVEEQIKKMGEQGGMIIRN